MENKQPKIHAAIAAIMAEIGAVKKESYNQGQRFYFRGIDQVMNELHPLLAKHGVAIVPEVLNYHREERKTANGGNLIYSVLTIRYHFTADDGSEVCATVIGEGMDSGDKASNKAMAVAFKYACFQVFCIPTEEIDKADPDSYTPEASEITEAQLITFINNCDSVADLRDLATMYEANIKGNPAALNAYQQKKGELK